MHDLILKYQFTDRAGRCVYNIASFAERKIGEIEGQIRMKKGEDIVGAHVLIDWVEPTKSGSVNQDTDFKDIE